MLGVCSRGAVLPACPPEPDWRLVVWTGGTLPLTSLLKLGVAKVGMVCPSKVPKLDAKLEVGKSDKLVLASSAKLDTMLELMEDI